MRDISERMVRISKGFWLQVPDFRTQFVDQSDEFGYSYPISSSGPVQILNVTVPTGRIWLIDNFYFWAKTPEPFVRLLPPGSIEDTFVFNVQIEGTNNIFYNYGARSFGLIGLPTARLPFLNDRLGPREQTFGIWLVEGESFVATYEMLPGAPPPVDLINKIGFRLQATQADRAYVEELIERQR